MFAFSFASEQVLITPDCSGSERSYSLQIGGPPGGGGGPPAEHHHERGLHHGDGGRQDPGEWAAVTDAGEAEGWGRGHGYPLTPV